MPSPELKPCKCGGEAFARRARCDRPERAPVNAAAIREALKKIADMKLHLGDFAEPVNGDSSAIYENAKWDGKKFLGREIPAWWGAGWREVLSRAIDTARAALAATARNCDRMPDIDQLTVSDLAESPCKSTLEYASREELLALVRWLLAPAKGGKE